MKRILSFLAVAAMVALSACHPEPILSVSPDSLSFSESGGSQTVQISANYPWTASVSGSGFSVSPSSGEGNGTVTVTASAASSPDAVTGSLSVRSEGLSTSVSLNQSAKPTLILGDGAKVPAEGGSVELQIQYNTDYIVEVEASAQSWIKFIKTKSLSSGKLEFEISPNEGDERSGKVTVKDGSGKAAPVTATITQAAETKVLVVGDAAVIPSEGATVEVDVKYNVDYAVEIESAAQSWIHYVETKAVKEGKLVFKVDANVTTEERSGTVTLKDKSGKVSAVTITFIQEGETKVLVVGDAATVPPEGGTLEVPISYNTDYTVTIEDAAKSWIRYVETKTVLDRKLIFSIDPNEGDERVGRVTITDTSGEVDPVTITIAQQAEAKVLVVGDAATVPAEGATVEVDVQYNVDYSVEVEDAAKSWIHYVETKAVQSGKLVFKVDANETTEKRTGTVTIKDRSGKVNAVTITFTQEGETKVLVVGDAATVPPEGGTLEVPISYNTDYSVTIEDAAKSWIHYIETKSVIEGKLVFFVDVNEGDERVGRVTITDTSGEVDPVTITIAQQAEAKVLVVGDAATVPAEGATVEVDVQYNVDYSVEVEDAAKSWIHYVETKAVQSGKLVFKVDANETTEERTGTVTIKDNSGKVNAVTITFTQEEAHVINVGEPTVVPAEGATVEVDVQYNVDYSVEVEDAAKSWIHYVETKAVQSGKLVFKVDANETADERSGIVTLTDKSGRVDPVTITFTQEEALVINVGEPTVVPALGGPVIIPVEYNAEYVVNVDESAQSWIRVIRTKALFSGEIELEVSENHGDERTGNLTVTALGGKVAPIVLTIVQEKSPEVEIRRILMDFYDAMDGPNWKNNVGWGTDRPVKEWYGISYYSGELLLLFSENGLKGEIPESIGELEGLLTGFVLQNEPGVGGRLPDSFRKLVNLRELNLYRTSMTSLPDVFADMKSLADVSVVMNEKMTGPLPESVGGSPVMERLALVSDMFTGGVPASWAALCGRFSVGENCLTGKLPAAILATKEYEWLQDDVLFQREGYGFDLSDVEVHGGRFWPKGPVEDLMGGDPFSFDEIISRNKCTVYLNWSLWDPFSKPLMNELKELYDLYHEDGLDIIATIMNSPDGITPEEQRAAIEARGYDGWHHYYYPSLGRDDTISMVPCAEVYDSNGNIIYSSFSAYPDPVRDRFGKTASIDMVPFLLGIFEPETYTSTDYSMDGEVMTLQKASVGNGIDIVFMGDAFTDKDMGKGGFYETIMSQSMEEFFAIEPYKTFRNRFNVYAVKVVSPNGRVGEGYTTALGTVLAGGTEIWGNLEKAEEYSLKVPSITDTENLLTCVMVRSTKYAGTCIMSRVKQSAVALTSTEGYDRALFGNTLRHEAGGHGFGFLSDEYYYYEETVPAEKKEEYTSLYEQFGWYSNVDFTNDPKKVHWSAFLSDERYKDEVGVFEGGALYNFGVWRPSVDSMMYENAEYFNAPSRWAIYKRIMELSGEEYSFEKFLEYDAVNRGKAAAAPRPPLKAAARRHSGHTAPPVILP